VGRCRRPKDEPIAPSDARRLVLFPDETAVVAPSGPSGGGTELPEAIALGRASSGAATLLLHFEVPIVDKGEVTAAFLVLDPVEGAPPPGRPVDVEVARILEPWRADAVSWGRLPRLDVPERAGRVGGRMAGPARFDVTHVVREWARRRPEDHGLAVLADPADPFGASYSLGVSGGQGPRLEVYVR
jgi:hypothetical protein